MAGIIDSVDREALAQDGNYLLKQVELSAEGMQ